MVSDEGICKISDFGTTAFPGVRVKSLASLARSNPCTSLCHCGFLGVVFGLSLRYHMSGEWGQTSMGPPALKPHACWLATTIRSGFSGLARKHGTSACNVKHRVFPISVRWSAPEVHILALPPPVEPRVPPAVVATVAPSRATQIAALASLSCVSD